MTDLIASKRNNQVLPVRRTMNYADFRNDIRKNADITHIALGICIYRIYRVF